MIKRIFIGILYCNLCFISVSAQETHFFMRTEELPRVIEYLPNYHQFNSPLFYNDSIMYEEGKKLRRTERGITAIKDANISIEYLMSRFGEAMERKLTPQEYPELSTLMQETILLIRSTITAAKNHYARMRPYQYFKEPSSIPSEENPTDYTSYPSGHSLRGWALALALINIDPLHQEEILKTGYEIGQSRVISGFHFQSDVDAARIVASAGMARLISSKSFQKQLKKAKKEFEHKK